MIYMSLFKANISDVDLKINVGEEKLQDKIESNKTAAESPQNSDNFCFFYHSVLTARPSDANLVNKWVSVWCGE